MVSLIDKNGEVLEIGDWILYNPMVFDAEIIRFGKISGITGNEAIIYYKNNSNPWHRNGDELIKLTDDEAMLWLLEQ